MAEETRHGRLIWVVVFLAIVYIVWFNYHKFVATKNYDFYVEAPCDETLEVCYVRDCEDYCPPNGLATYKVWQLSAADFGRCADDSCDAECTSGEIACEAVPCDAEEADCSGTE
ncbi:hypothetical protein A2704_02340 [Candidatus Kaiserbacteria bacterium RIFCSPHIGHO2_01_FULL_54_36b]|uniref:Uncharacterized protein n=1 Tax=Candidatus Kaiserbacteria bacterium RIFCSPHIGHO2_01_FULL_54_36b TaxID=1798483 RepID=A0A1F6CMZ5_9BACT|nr:MAG: hypothetical protein A2704_02340 [Candidatus Kaiserbacteria bacterium RIFCSPHIGHO2_01_FULL_54_36b]